MDEKATQLHAIASLKVLLDATRPQNGAAAMANHAGGSASMGGLEAGSAAAAAAAMGNRSQQETELVAAGSEQPNGVLGQDDGGDPVSTLRYLEM